VEELDALLTLAARVVAEGVAPVVAVGFASRRTGRWELSAGGATEALFDLASVTKPMTALAAARSGLPRETELGVLLEEARGTPCEHASLELLLAHRAGLEAHVPLYRELVHGGTFDRDAALREALTARRAECPGPIPAAGFPPLYSDMGYLLVGEALRRHFRVADFGEVLARAVIEPLGLARELGSVRALREAAPDACSRMIATEVVSWRGGLVDGEVHDENAFAWAGEGACGHAGAFGTAAGVLRFGCGALDAIARGEGPLAATGSLEWLVAPREGGALRAGFDGKSEGGTSSAGVRSGPRTFGHLGFTGTSLWIDPDADAVTVLLTNRVHPTRDNLAIRAARPWVHDALFALAAGVR